MDCHADMTINEYYGVISALLRNKRYMAEYLDKAEQMSQALALTDIALRNVCKEAAAAGHTAGLQKLACNYGDNMTVIAICTLCKD